MKSNIVALAVLAVSTVASASYISSQNFPLCSYWSFNSQGGGYSCHSTQYVQVPSTTSLQVAISKLEQENATLDARVKKLEGQLAKLLGQ